MVLDIRKKNKDEGDCKSTQTSRRVKVILLIIFCLLSGGISFYTANRSFSGKHDLSISDGSIKTPKHIHEHSKEISTAVRISEEEYQRIHKFKQYLDSIANEPFGRKTFDSIITARPGLLDSILIIEHIYLSQTKN